MRSKLALVDTFLGKNATYLIKLQSVTSGEGSIGVKLNCFAKVLVGYEYVPILL